MPDSRGQPHNPYASPQAPMEMEPLPLELGADNLILPCPSCQSNDVTPVPYDPMRGRAGPLAAEHVRCQRCGVQFNGKTGQPIETRMLMNLVLPFLILVVGLGGFVLYVALLVLLGL